ncbi:EAL domain-containing protein [Janthinobacterium fluminis]|uniref:EAL domain-containing protein n=1 Tax=Janthinobacterium fluminis TaxID=2987524 RepID=A0ABT5K0L5_9BURK|nr:EAL domain-containing protein [Janthinobacterium fluminis]MDC8758495.1 EAL domain-containing protein [Janthinobacterium fluminis]
MKISTLGKCVAVATIAMLVAMGLVIFRVLQIEQRVVLGAEHRRHSLMLADELFQSSEDLSRMARSYVSTGDLAYERHYDAILGIRNGTLPRPLRYSPTYWNLAGVDRGPAVAAGTAVALRELMRREGVADDEFALLHTALAYSDALVTLERHAFAAVGERHAFERQAAVGLLYGPRYLDAKASIMAPISRFVDAIDARTKGELQALQRQLQRLVLLLMTLVVLALVGVSGIIVYTRRAVLRPLGLLGRHAEQVARGDYAARCAVPPGNELSKLGRHFNDMLAAIERDIGQRERAEQALERANGELAGRQALLQQILDTSSVAIFLVDLEGRLTHANERMADMFGWPLRALIGKSYVELVHPSERASGQQKMLALLGSQIVSVDLERHYWRADDTAFLGHLTGKRFYDGAGVERGLVGVIADVTARRLAEQRTQHHNQVLAMLAAKAALPDVLDAIAADVEAIYPAMLSCILLLDEDGRRLRVGAAPSLPDDYRAGVDGIAVDAGGAPFSTAAFAERRVIVADIAGAAAGPPLLELAFQAGLGACWSQPIRSSQGKVLGIFAIFHRHARAPAPGELQFLEDEARLAALAIDQTGAEARLQLAASVFTHAREGIMITDADGIIIEVNDTFTRITGYSHQEALGQTPRILNSGRQPPDYYAAMWRALIDTGHWDGEAWNRRKNGEVHAEMITISAVRDAAGKTQNYVALFTDITPFKEHQRQLEYIAHYDALTGLPNRVLLADRLQHALAQSQRRSQSLALVYLDLDGFKAVNDHHGHQIGDALLVTLSQRMQAALREGDTIARIGGDEFVAVLVDLDRPQDCEPVLERLLRAAADPVQVEQQALRVSASIGVTLYPRDGADADLLMRHADQAMYLAKQAGKNRYHLFDVEQDQAEKIYRESIARISLGLEQGEFVLHYQPRVNMRSGAVIGAEALVRWQHPQRGLLPPAAFLPVIDEHQVSVELGEWVIGSALAQISAWRAAGLELPVSVNVGARQLQQNDFGARLAALLAAQPDVPAGYLELEILETSALEDMAQVSEVMHACRAIGVNFALDDFGTGYSSLTYLKRLPVEWLKIDQSFVRDMLEDPEDLAIIEGVAGLAAAFRRQLIAEGVETTAHGELLLLLGCTLAQGFGIAEAMPAAELPGWVAGWRPDPAWSAWRDRAPTPSDRMTVFAEVELRHWLRGIDGYLDGGREEPAPLDAHAGHFGRWLEHEGRALYGQGPAFAALPALHAQVHALGRELVELRRAGRGADATAQLGRLHALRDELIGRLRRLVRSA